MNTTKVRNPSVYTTSSHFSLEFSFLRVHCSVPISLHDE